MAANGHRSLVGKVVSLITHSRVRYKGLVYSHNPETISLEDAKDYGTEGRVPGPQIPPSDQVHEHMIIQQRDIMALQVVEEEMHDNPLIVQDSQIVVEEMPDGTPIVQDSQVVVEEMDDDPPTAQDVPAVVQEVYDDPPIDQDLQVVEEMDDDPPSVQVVPVVVEEVDDDPPIVQPHSFGISFSSLAGNGGRSYMEESQSQNNQVGITIAVLDEEACPVYQPRIAAQLMQYPNQIGGPSHVQVSQPQSPSTVSGPVHQELVLSSPVPVSEHHTTSVSRSELYDLEAMNERFQDGLEIADTGMDVSEVCLSLLIGLYLFSEVHESDDFGRRGRD